MHLIMRFHPYVHFSELLIVTLWYGTALFISSTTAQLLTIFFFSGHVPLSPHQTFKKLYLYGNDETNNDQSGSLCVVMDIFKYAVWKSKQRQRLPNIISLSRDISFILDLACTANVSFRHTTGNINLIANLFQARG